MKKERLQFKLLRNSHLLVGDLLLNENGDIYKVTRANSLGFSQRRGCELVDVAMQCLMNSNFVSAMNANRDDYISLHPGWVWHSRHGCLLT